jgi:hypothetical protein
MSAASASTATTDAHNKLSNPTDTFRGPAEQPAGPYCFVNHDFGQAINLTLPLPALTIEQP